MSRAEIRLTLPGRPVGYVRTTTRMRHDPRVQRVMAWREALAWAARAAGAEPWDGPVAVDATFLVRRRLGRRPDLDNLLKAVLDGLAGVCYRDDRQVTSLAGRIVTAPDGAEATEVWVGRVV